MSRKLTISLDEDVYNGLYQVVSREKISKFIEDLLRPYVANQGMKNAYKQMADDEEREREAFEWTEALIGDIANEAR